MEAVETRWQRGWTWLRGAQAERVLRVLVVGLAGFFVALFVYTAARRLRYPYDLEWVESGVLVSVRRLVNHQQLYAQPSLDYVPYLYAPLYFYVCAFFAKWTGVTFFTLRLVSTLSALGTLGVLFAFVYRETRDAFAAMAAMGVFASLYAFFGAWFDIGRVDSLFLLFLMLALYCTRFAPPIVAALVWVLAFQTKQSALALAIPFLLTYWEPRRKSRVFVALGSYAVLAWASIEFFNRLSGGWYSFYVFGAAGGLPGHMRTVAFYISEVLLSPFGVAVLLIVASVIFVPPNWRSCKALFYGLGTLTMVGAFWFVRSHAVGNNTMEALYLWLAPLFAVALHRLLQWLRDPATDTGIPAASNWRGAATAMVLLAVLIQLGAQMYNPGQFIPPAVQLQARAALIAQMREIPGRVYVMNHSFDAVLAGKEPQAEAEAMGAVVDAFPGKWSEALIAELQQKSRSHYWDALIVDSPPHESYGKWVTSETTAAYPVRVAAGGSDAFRFLTSQPNMVLMPCAAATKGLAQRISPAGEQANTLACGRAPY